MIRKPKFTMKLYDEHKQVYTKIKGTLPEIDKAFCKLKKKLR